MSSMTNKRDVSLAEIGDLTHKMSKQIAELEIKELLGRKGVTTLGERIAAGRKIRGWDQSELASRMKVSRASVSDWESGKIKNLRLPNLFKLADVLELNARWLSLGEGSPVKRFMGDEEEHDLIDLFRGLQPKTRADLLATARSLHTKDNTTPTKRSPYPTVA